MSKSHVFWYQDPLILFDQYYLTQFIPLSHMSLEEKLNSVVRFGLYIGILLSVAMNKISYLYIGIATALMTYFIYMTYPDQKGGSAQESSEFLRPTKDNPFMNTMITDYNSTKKIPAADVLDEDVKADIEKNFNKGLYKNVNDIWGRNNSQRQYYTTPSTTVPNDRDSFVKFCFSTPPTCKEGNLSRCLKTEDLRGKRVNLTNQTL